MIDKLMNQFFYKKEQIISPSCISEVEARIAKVLLKKYFKSIFQTF